MDLEEALEQFDLTAANLSRLESIWSEMEDLIPGGIAFVEAGPEGRRYRELTRAYEEIAGALPGISGFRVQATPMGLDAIGQARLDAADLGELWIETSLEEDIYRPSKEIEEYRFRFEAARRDLVRDHVSRLSAEVARNLAGLADAYPSDGNRVDDPRIEIVKTSIGQVERLAGDQVPRTKAWVDLQRHLGFREGQDIHAMAQSDWPTVSADLARGLYTELEPLPVATKDLADVLRSKPQGSVSIELLWADLSDDEFERVIFNLISAADDYENAQWLTATNAPDRGRDLAAEHVRRDTLSGPFRERVIVQARHWLKKSVGLPQVRQLLDQMKLWEPPPVHTLVIATSGRFTTDAVSWIEGHNNANDRPVIVMWPNSHLETLVARRPELSALFPRRSR